MSIYIPSTSSTVTQTQLNQRVAKSQLTTTGATSGVVQIDGSGNCNVSNLTTTNGISSFKGITTTGIQFMPVVYSVTATNTTTATVLTWTPTVDTEYQFSGTIGCVSWTSGSAILNFAYTPATTGSAVSGSLIGVVPGSSGTAGSVGTLQELSLYTFTFRAKASTSVTFSVTGTFVMTWRASIKITRSE